jgi:energy-coupling factor transporter ATP-binding protein EcfA2
MPSDPTWFTNLDQSVQDLLLGGTGNLIGNLATQAVNGLLDAARKEARRRFAPPATRQALDDALAQALAQTVAWLTDDRDEASHFVTLLAAWLGRAAVIEQLDRLVEPVADAELDLALLTEEFSAAGWSAEHLGAGRSFPALVATLTEHFYQAAARQPALQGVIAIGLLRGLAARLTHLAAESATQSDLLRTITALLERFAPLPLGEVERAYLRRLYRQCNDLPLARDERALPEGGPRLQRVYVDLYLDLPPTLAQVSDRLALPTAKRRQAVRLLQEGWVGGPDAELRAPRLKEAAALGAPLGRALDDEQRQQLAQELEMDDERRTAALTNVTPVELLAQQRQFVLLGDPGSGKSTLTQRLAALLAVAGAEEAALLHDLGEEGRAALDDLLTALGGWRLPLRVVLSRWAQRLTDEQLAAPACTADLLIECLRLLGQTTVGLTESQERTLKTRLEANPPTLLLLLDGLDEVSDEARRRFLLAAIGDFHQAYPQVPLIVTCRVRPYRAWQESGAALPLPVFALAPLTPPVIERFLGRWHAELVRAGLYEAPIADQAQTWLARTLRDPARRELQEMARTPLLLTMMTSVNYRHGLPDSRAKLYDRFVHQLLYEWERRKQTDPGQPAGLDRLLRAAGVDDNKLNHALNGLAFAVHAQRLGDDTVDIAGGDLQQALLALHPGPRPAAAGWAVEVLDLIADRSGLLHRVDTAGVGVYKFSYGIFQEYLAARWLATGSDYVRKFRDKIDQEAWRESLLLAIGFQVAVQNPPVYDAALIVIDELWHEEGLDEAARWRRWLLLGEAYIQLLTPQGAQLSSLAASAQRMNRTIPPDLTTLLQNPAAPPATRLAAGLLLADLALDPPGLDDWVTINAARSLGDEFRMGRYPVTNAQFRRFVDDGGYAPANETRWWSTEGRKWKEQYNWTQPRYWNDPHCNRRTQPVVGVSWYEAEAYCVWLTAQLREQGEIKETEEIRLPTRQEWEAAARGSHGRKYPWGSDDFDPRRANTKESELSQTTPVHMYPTGSTPTGVWDMAGNVWEWTNEIDVEGWVYLKGGSCYNDAEGAKVSAAGGGYARYGWQVDYGFRVVVVPLSRAR